MWYVILMDCPSSLFDVGECFTPPRHRLRESFSPPPPLTWGVSWGVVQKGWSKEGSPLRSMYLVTRSVARYGSTRNHDVTLLTTGCPLVIDRHRKEDTRHVSHSSRQRDKGIHGGFSFCLFPRRH